MVISGDLILLIAGLISFYFYLRSIGEVKPFALVKFVYLAMFTKLAICLLPVIVYILWSGKEVDKAGLLLCAFMYIVYSYTEISLLLNYNKQRTNAQAGSPS
jgi:Cu/Ag efflux pump CusA